MKAINWMGSIFTLATLALPSATASTSRMIRLTDRLLLWLERSQQRAALGRLDGRMLADIGCDRATAQCEAGKPFWKE